MARARGSNSKSVETLPPVSNWEKPIRAQTPADEPAPAPAETSYENPPWSKVWLTTIRVMTRRWRFRVVLIAFVGLVIAALLLGYRALFPAADSPAAERPAANSLAPGAAADPVVAAEQARTAAVSWVAINLSRTSVLACDRATCAELEAHGYPATALVPLTADAGEIRRADLAVVTAAVQTVLGRNLPELTASQPLAVFGAGEAAIELRVVTPDGPDGYEQRAAIDRRQRAGAGAQLARSSRLELAPEAGEELRAGRVDTRILTVLPALLADHRLAVQQFSVSPEEPPGSPLRILDVARVDDNAVAADDAGTESIIRFLNAQWPPFLPSWAEVVDAPAGRVLRITYPAPSPLGLLGSGSTAQTVFR